MPKESKTLEYNMHKVGEWIATAIGKTMEGMRWASEKMFILIKLFAAFLLVIILILILINVYKDRAKLSVKPFSVPEKMQKAHKAAGSIIANIIKQNLMSERAKIDGIIKDKDESGGPVIKNELISNDKSFLKGDNIKLPETSISINDVIEFLSGLFGRKNITGSVYEDNNTLYLQIEITGDIFTTERSLEGKGKESSLHVKLIEEMADDATHNILIMASEKYRLYFFCTDEHSHSGGKFEHSEYKKLYELCNRINRSLPDVPDIVRADLKNKIDKDNLSDSSNIEQYILTFLSNKISRSAITQPVDDDQKGTQSLSDTIQVALESQWPHDETQSTPSPGESNDTDALGPTNTNKSQTDTIKKRLSISKLLQLEKTCEEKQNPNGLRSSTEEKSASIAYKKKEFSTAEKAYIRAIEANCSNPYAWANLGILLSDLKNTVHFDPIEAAVALHKATVLKPKAGWMWHSLCVAEAYSKEDGFEEAINSQPCRKARLVEPGKQLIYDKLFNIAVAEKYKHLGKDNKAFDFYKTAIVMDPKRTCRLKSVVEQIDSIIVNAELNNRQEEICDVLSSTYPAAKPDEACEETLATYQDDHC